MSYGQHLTKEINVSEKRKRVCGLVNRSAARNFLLEFAARNRAHRFTRVGDAVYDQLEAALREKCRSLVNAQPSCGKTIK
jgi:hypothetical protein